MIEIKLAEKKRCTGCGACSTICPKSCIEMSHKDTIHNYPIVNRDACIACGRCMSVCPPLNVEQRLEKNIPDYKEQKFYAAWHNSVETRKTATSGAVACGLYQTAVSMGYTICGAAFDEHWHLSHVLSKEVSDIEKFKGSKYLQSDTYSTYNQILSSIKSGEKVLFSGTPCQVDALCRLVPGHLRSQIITCAIVCHGVNSPSVWEDFITDLQKSEKQKIVNYNFRSKAFGWGKLAIDYTLADGKKIVKPARENLFHYWFGQHFLLRPTCIKCSYRGVQRFADITIGDFWGIEQIIPQLDTRDGISVLITSSRAGELFVRECKNLTLLKCDALKTANVLKGFLQKRSESILDAEVVRAADFEKEYIAIGYKNMAKKYRVPSTLSRYIKLFLKK